MRALLTSLLFLMAACSTAAAPTATPEQLLPPEPNQTGGSTLDPATEGPEGIPIPASARAAGPNSYDVPGATFDQLRGWYEGKLPFGQPFGAWAWCERLDRDTFSQWNYYHPGTSDLLGVVVLVDDPPSILIGVDDSGPC